MFVQLTRHPRYLVSDQGEVVSTFKGKWKILKLSSTTGGYIKARLNGKTYTVHKLVAEAFLGPANGLQVNHKNGAKTDNRIENLEYCTHAENAQHAWATGLCEVTRHATVTRNQSSRRFTQEVIKQVQRLKDSGLSQAKVAKQFGMSQAYVFKLWKQGGDQC